MVFRTFAPYNATISVIKKQKEGVTFFIVTPSLLKKHVVRESGLEPETNRLKVYCSTN